MNMCVYICLFDFICICIYYIDTVCGTLNVYYMFVSNKKHLAIVHRL